MGDGEETNEHINLSEKIRARIEVYLFTRSPAIKDLPENTLLPVCFVLALRPNRYQSIAHISFLPKTQVSLRTCQSSRPWNGQHAAEKRFWSLHTFFWRLNPLARIVEVLFVVVALVDSIRFAALQSLSTPSSKLHLLEIVAHLADSYLSASIPRKSSN